jgi:hypothetical protein
MSGDLVTRVESACTQLVEGGEAVTFTAVAKHAGVAKATLYRRPELRAIVEEHRRGHREAHSLSGIVIEIDLLRQRLAGTKRNFALCGVRSSSRNDNAQAIHSTPPWGQIGPLTMAERLDREFQRPSA